MKPVALWVIVPKNARTLGSACGVYPDEGKGCGEMTAVGTYFVAAFRRRAVALEHRNTDWPSGRVVKVVISEAAK